MALQIGDIIDGKYRIVRLLGEGGMGAVFEGENTRIHRRVAIKVLHAGVAQSADAVQRFEREAQAAGRIGSEHIVEVLDLGNLPDGERYMVMEYLEGESLSERITSRGRVTARAVAGLAIDMLEGLRAAHDAGIIHRDLKPDNVYLLSSRAGKRDFVKLVDFGISKFNAMGGEFSMTRTGAVMGTPYYMSPEQAKGNRDVDHRADLYAAGVILYEAVAGEVPFNAETFNELLFKIVLETPPSLLERVPGLDPGFVALVERSMARDPAARFQTASEFQDALRQWLAGQPLAPDVTAPSGTPTSLERTSLHGVPEARTVGHGSQGEGGTPANPVTATAGTPASGVVSPQTQGSWAQTGGYRAPHNNSKKILIAAASVLLVGAGGGVYAFRSSASAAEEARLLARSASEQREQEQQRELARLQAENVKADAARAEAEKARRAAEEARWAAELDERRQREAEKAAAEKAAAEKVAARPAPAAGSTAQRRPPVTPPEGSSEPKPAPPAGRVIRTDL